MKILLWKYAQSIIKKKKIQIQKKLKAFITMQYICKKFRRKIARTINYSAPNWTVLLFGIQDYCCIAKIRM